MEKIFEKEVELREEPRKTPGMKLRLAILISLALFFVSFFFPTVDVMDESGFEFVFGVFIDFAALNTFGRWFFWFMVISPNIFAATTALFLWLKRPELALPIAVINYIICIAWSYTGFSFGLRIGHFLWHLGILGLLITSIWLYALTRRQAAPSI